MNHFDQLEEDNPRDVLWAFNGKLLAVELNESGKKQDHVTWFRKIGLPDFGPAFDQIPRGRMEWDWHYNHWNLIYYQPSLPNEIYEMVVKRFNTNGAKVVEKKRDLWV